MKGGTGRTLALATMLALIVLGIHRLRGPEADVEVRDTRYVFGTLVEIVVRGADPVEARTAVSATGRLLQTLHHDWHAWRPGALSTLNDAIADGRAAEVDPQLADLLRAGQQLACASEGLFNPGIGRLVALWGFHADTPPQSPPPAASEIAALRAADPQMTDLVIDGQIVRSTNPSLQLDLGGYAKGAALDLAAADLAARGIRDAVLNAGGDVNVLGDHGARPWRVAIRDPFVWGALATVTLDPGEVLYTSGNYERYFEHEGERFAHIIDPRSGHPVREIVSVSVLDTEGVRADAAATALSVAGRERFAAVAAALEIDAAVMVTDRGEVLATPAMVKRIEASGGPLPAGLTTVALPADVQPSPCGAQTGPEPS